MQTGTKEKSTPAPKVENNGRKKRKIELNFCFTTEIIFEIIQYFEDPNDYLNLAQLNKYYYETMLINDSYLFNKFTDILIQFMRIKLSNNLPNYMFKIQKLNITSSNSDFNLLQKFTNLKYFQVECVRNNYCKLNETSFTNLKQLTSLNISKNNKLHDEWLKDLHNLTELKITSCENIKGDCFNHFKQLKYLDIYNCNKITDDCLNNFNNLVCLNIIQCKKITGTCLINLKKLQKLTIDIQDISGLKYLEYLIYLTTLNIIINIQTNEQIDLSFLQFLTKIVTLKIKFNVLCNINDSYFFNLTCLKSLKLTNLLPYDMLEFKGNCFKYLMSLETLSLNKILFDEQNIKYLTNVVNLTIKYIEEIKINEKFLNLKNLYKLCITDCLTVNIKENLQSLRIVKIFESEVFGNFNCFPNLKELILYHTNVKDKQIMNLDKLQSLEIYPSITGECLASLTQLKKLDVQDIKEYKYLSYLKNLTDLSIRCTSIKDQDLNTLTNLKYLDISCCANIKSGKFLLNMNDLIELTCFDLVKYTGTGLDNLKNKIKNDGVTLYEYYKENNGRHLDN